MIVKSQNPEANQFLEKLVIMGTDRLEDEFLEKLGEQGMHRLENAKNPDVDFRMLKIPKKEYAHFFFKTPDALQQAENGLKEQLKKYGETVQLEVLTNPRITLQAILDESKTRLELIAKSLQSMSFDSQKHSHDGFLN